MKDDVLFQITRENLETGLRGYPVGYCSTSYVDPQKGLFYRGIPVETLANTSPEEVIYLLYYGKESDKDSLRVFKQELCTLSQCSKIVLEQIRKLPRDTSPMKLFSCALLLTGMFSESFNYEHDCLQIIAQAPILAAQVIAHHAGWGEIRPSMPELGYIENFCQMLNMPLNPSQDFLDVMKLFNILHYDHGGGNLSTFVAKAVASGLEDMYGSLAAGVLALEGPRHGRANQDCFEFVQLVLQTVGESATEEHVEQLIRTKLAKGELVFGFGHAVLRVEDPRAQIFYDFCEKRYPVHPLVKISRYLRKAGQTVLKENSKIQDPYPNVDAISGVALVVSGFSFPQYMSVLFAMSRMVGISRQIVYERCEARDRKGTPIVRPKYFYLGNEEVSG